MKGAAVCAKAAPFIQGESPKLISELQVLYYSWVFTIPWEQGLELGDEVRKVEKRQILGVWTLCCSIYGTLLVLSHHDFIDLRKI